MEGYQKKKSQQKTLDTRIKRRCNICKLVGELEEVEVYSPNKLQHEETYHDSKYFKLEEIRKNDEAWYPVIKILIS